MPTDPTVVAVVHTDTVGRKTPIARSPMDAKMVAQMVPQLILETQPLSTQLQGTRAPTRAPRKTSLLRRVPAENQSSAYLQLHRLLLLPASSPQMALVVQPTKAGSAETGPTELAALLMDSAVTAPLIAELVANPVHVLAVLW